VEVLISAESIAARVREIAGAVSLRYAGGDIVAVPVLRGAFVFAADLLRSVRGVDVTIDFLGVSSYGSATETSGETRLTLDTTIPLAGRNVLLIEDIVDTGLTLAYIQKLLRSRGTASLSTAALLDKGCRRRVAVDVDWIGFEIPDRFVYGYGLDGPGGSGRNLPDIVAERTGSR
jgi:hypoxanthine phosphoribosyltransferase